MITYKLWEAYIDENWRWREYDYDELEKDALKMNGTEGVYPLFTIIDQD